MEDNEFGESRGLSRGILHRQADCSTASQSHHFGVVPGHFSSLLQFAQKELGKSPSLLAVPDLNAALIGASLDNLEKTRANASRSQNVRLTAIRSFFRHMALECPEHSAAIQRVLAIPPKRQSSRLVDFLTRPEIEALLAVPDQTTCLGRRDRVLLLFAIQTGLRLSELIGLRQADIYLERGAHVRSEGKGRKQRCTPLTQTPYRL